MKLTINVTAEDIEAGISCNYFRCPIAQAMLRQIPGCEAEALHRALWMTRENGVFYAIPPQSAKDFMTDFDNCRPVQPFSFEAEFKKYRFLYDLPYSRTLT